MIRNWKTTLLGIAGGALTLIANGLDPWHALQAAALAGLGLTARDHDRP